MLFPRFFNKAVNRMTVTLYNSTDNPKKIGKTLTGGTAAKTIKPYEPVSDLTGTILLAYDNTEFNYNYMVINYNTAQSPDLAYYFITDKELELGGKVRLTLKPDLLETYKNSIKNCPAILERTKIGNAQNLYLPDGEVPIQQNPRIVIHSFGTFSYLQSQIVANIVG